MYKGYSVLDGHVHYCTQLSAQQLASFLAQTGTDMANIVTVPHSRCVSLTPGALMLKAAAPEKYYVYAGADAAIYFLRPEAVGEQMAEFGQRMLRCGCDGIKLLEGKPQMRKLLPIPDFDENVWEPFWGWAEENGVPLLWHVNDPENFWDWEHAPEVARQQGWVYDESYVNNEAQYAQVLNVLARHPGLRVIFAHFFFFSAQLPRLREIFDTYSGVMVDLTPGIEMYENFSAGIEETRAFFRRYSDRIIYGTDIAGRCSITSEDKPFDEAENRRRPEIPRQFIAGDEGIIVSDGHYLIDREPFLMRSPALTEEAKKNVFSDNFIRFTGGRPRPVDGAAVLAECSRLRGEMAELAEKYPSFHADYTLLAEAEKAFAI